MNTPESTALEFQRRCPFDEGWRVECDDQAIIHIWPDKDEVAEAFMRLPGAAESIGRVLMVLELPMALLRLNSTDRAFYSVKPGATEFVCEMLPAIEVDKI